MLKSKNNTLRPYQLMGITMEEALKMKRRYLRRQLSHHLERGKVWVNHLVTASLNSLWFVNDQFDACRVEIIKLRRSIFWLNKRIANEKNGYPPAKESFDIEEIKNRVKAEQVIGKRPEYKSSTREKYFCPLHVEKTPSFVWNIDKKYYHCFGCGESGDIINLYMKLNNCDFISACRELQYL